MERTKRRRSSSWIGPKSSPQCTGLHTGVSSRTVLDLLSNQYAPIYDRICKYLPINAICALVRTAKKFGHLHHDLRKTQWNVDVKLSRFVDNPKAFRMQMAANQALVSGSFAVQFFGRVVFTDSDLDVFIHSGEGAQAFERYLAEDECYKFVRRMEPEEYQDNFKFIHQVISTTNYTDLDAKQVPRLTLSPARRPKLSRKPRFKSSQPLVHLFGLFSANFTPPR